MTLKLTRFLTDIMNKQAKISHFAQKIKVGKPSNIQLKFKEKITEQFGELFLNDANYIIMTSIDSAVSDSDKFIGKFVELVSHVLNTKISKSEAKTLNLNENENIELDNTDDDIENEDMPHINEKNILFIKITTK